MLVATPERPFHAAVEVGQVRATVMTIPNRLSEPRSVLGTAIMFGTVLGPIYLVVAALLGAFSSRLPLNEVVWRTLLQSAFFVCLVAPMMGSLFRGVTVVIPVADRLEFLAVLNVGAAQLGYHPAFNSEAFLSFSPSWQTGKLTGRLAVQLLDDRAVIVGPKLYTRRLAVRLAARLSCTSA